MCLLLLALLLPSQIAETVRLARSAARQGDWQEARRLLEQGLKENPKDPALLHAAGVLNARMGNLNAALRYLEAVPEGEAPAGYWKDLGRTLLSLGRLEEAEGAFLKNLENRPGTIETLRALSGIALKRGDTARAWEYVAEARREAPASPEVLYEFAQVSLAHDRIGDAVFVLKILLIMDPHRPEYLEALGNAVLNSQDYARAIDLFSRYLEHRPEDAHARFLLGYACFVNNQFDDARRELEKALRLRPGQPDARHYLGQVAYRQGDEERAFSIYRDILESNPDHLATNISLGKLYLRRGDLSGARTALERAVALDPSGYDVHLQLSRLYRLLGDPDRARQELELYRKYRAESTARAGESAQVRFSPDPVRKP